MRKIITICLSSMLIFTNCFTIVHASDEIVINDDTPQITLETETDSLKTEEILNISGVIFSDTGNGKIKLSIDGQTIDSEIEIFVSEEKDVSGDAQKDITSYQSYVDVSSLSVGEHNVKVQLISEDEKEIATADKKINIIPSPKPENLLTITESYQKEDVMIVKGIALETDTDLSFYVDGVLKGASVSYEQCKLNECLSSGFSIDVLSKGLYSAEISTHDISEGNHLLEVRMNLSSGMQLLEKTEFSVLKKVSNEQVQSRVFKSDVKNLQDSKISNKTMLWIDSPSNLISEANGFQVSGWVMSEAANLSIDVYVDGNLFIKSVPRQFRPDVLNSIKGYGDSTSSPKPGYSEYLDLKTVSVGSHTLTIKVQNQNGEVLAEESRKFTKRKAKSQLWLDLPSDKQTEFTSLRVKGWAMSEEKADNIDIYVDGNLIIKSATRVARQDVLNSVKGYGDASVNPLPGFDAVIDFSTISIGNHTLTVKNTTNTGEVLSEVSRAFSKRTANTSICIDNPSTKLIIKEDLNVSGWVMSDLKNSIVKVYVDGELKDSSVKRSMRPDVIQAVRGFGGAAQNPYPGFSSTVNVEYLSSGQHTLSIKVFSQMNELLGENSVNFIKSKPKAMILLDTPVNGDSKKGTIDISGWAMGEDKYSVVQLYIDGSLVNGALNRVERGDVLNSVTGYGDVISNPKPGFHAEYNLDYLSGGEHTITLKYVSRTGEVIASTSSVITVNNAMMKGIDVSEHNGVINWDQVKASGIQFAMIRVGWGHFVEDAQFRRNVAECERLNIPYGFYHYSYALNMEEAQREADGLINAISGTHPSLPVFIDMEDADGYKERNGMPSDYILQQICAYTSDRLTQAGYRAGIYASLYWFNTKLNSSSLDKYEKWVAQWNVSCDYTKPYILWQYTSSGSVPGISGRVDMNYAYPGIIR